MNGEPRSDRLGKLVADEGLDQLLVGDLVHPSETGREAGANLRWLTGFTGSSGLALIGAEERLFFTDFRYAERAEREVGSEFERVTVERGLIPEPPSACAGASATTTRRRASRTCEARPRSPRKASSSSPRRGWWRGFAATRTPGSSRRSRRRRGSPMRSTSGSTSAGLSAGPRGRSCWTPTSACGSSEPPSRRSRQSSPLVRTALCPTTTPRTAR